MPKNFENSLCWKCANACTSGCSWAENLTPVEGWTAEYNKKSKTYCVKECPLFTPENVKAKRKDINDKGALLLMQCLLSLTREDYMMMPRLRPDIENWIRRRGGMLCMFDDPEGVIRKLKADAFRYDKMRATRSMIRGGL